MQHDEKEIILIQQPPLVNITLFLHQLKSIEQMEKMENDKEIELHPHIYVSTKIGVLADLPGYGKSLSVLGLIAQTLNLPRIEEKKTYILEKTTHHNYISLTKTEQLQTTNASLILVNVSLLSQWMYELSRTSLRYFAVHNRFDIENIDLEKYDVILVSNNVYNLFSQVYRKKCWKRFIVDEPASLKIHSMEETYAKFYWLITGTPNELYLVNKRRTGFLNNLLPEDFELFNYIILKNDELFVKSSYEMPITKHLFHSYLGNMSTFFEGIVSDSIIEMIQAGNVSGVFNSLVDDSFQASTIIDAFRLRKTKKIQELQKEEKTQNSDKIQTIENHLTSLNDKLFKYIIQYPCMICKNPHTFPMILSCFQNIFCGKCVDCLECPMCNSTDFTTIPMDVKKLDEFKDQVVITNQYSTKNKIETILGIIDDAVNKKILIFSNYNETFTVLKKFLEKKELSYLELKGTKEQRDNTIDSYKTGNVNILLLNTIHSGAGLNLQETSDIILYHRIYEYQKIQVIGRANRIGRKIPLNVHYLE